MATPMGCNWPLGRGLLGLQEGISFSLGALTPSAPCLQWNKVAAWAEVGKVSILLPCAVVKQILKR